MQQTNTISTIRRRPTRTLRPGFTLAEVMVVSVVLVILMSLAIPRLGATERRGFENAVDAVADLLLMYAHRDAVGAKAVALSYDNRRGSLMVMVLDDHGDPSETPEWIVDPFVRPLRLPPEVDAGELQIYADGQLADLAETPLAHAPGDNRPSIEVLLTSTSGEHHATLVLASHAVGPRRTDGNDRYAAREPVDLDRAGRSRENW